ncbi:prephenate dehydrogenase [Kitasatospora sp. NPDC094019]|uniref:prephenate dehydrogenase n=1 Tax=Kitasatospora sp. NPDC094019 TaxID=3364091 RepID=UPI0038080B76
MATSVEANSGVATAITLVEIEIAQLETQRAALEAELERVAGYATSLSVALDGLRAAEAALQPAVGATVEPSTPTLVPAGEAPAQEPEPVEDAAEPLPAADEPAQQKATRRRVPAPATATTEAAPAKRTVRKPRTTTAATEATAPAGNKPKTRTAKKTAGKKTTPPAPAAPTPAQRSRGIADDVLSALATAGRPLRAGEVSTALGADSTDNNVRTTLERLVKAGRAQRAGRGLFETLPNS